MSAVSVPGNVSTSAVGERRIDAFHESVMNDIEADRQLLGQSWKATPDNYSSMRFIRLEGDGTGELAYAYGQTIYAHIRCKWEIVETGILGMTYLGSKGGIFKDFVFDDLNRFRELNYTLTEGITSWEQDVVRERHTFQWTLELSEPPWPADMVFPYSVPRVFYGNAKQVS